MSTKMEISIMENINKIKEMDLEFLLKKTVRNTQVIGKIIKKMDKDFYSTIMVIFLKEIL
jgi:hypothetical protein